MDLMNATDPFALFDAWFQAAEAAEPEDANAMTLATATPNGRVSARIMLLKAFDRRGFVFFTNVESRKGDELQANPHAALCFHWKSLQRQVRIEGPVAPVTMDEADIYFATRPRDSRIGAWASEQSRVLEDRAVLDARIAEMEARYPGAVPRPPHWSGRRVEPDRIEFWSARPGRLHDRVVFIANGDGWRRELLYP